MTNEQRKDNVTWNPDEPRKANPELVDRSTDGPIGGVSEPVTEEGVTGSELAPTDITSYVLAWHKAIMILDASEVLVRDIIERELLDVAGLEHITIGVVNAATKRLMDNIREVRTEAIRTAFQVVRSRLGDEEIHGHSLATWAQEFLRFDLTNIETAVRTGLIQGKNNMEIARKVVGSMGLNGVDGVSEWTRHRLAHFGKAQIKSLQSYPPPDRAPG